PKRERLGPNPSGGLVRTPVISGASGRLIERPADGGIGTAGKFTPPPPRPPPPPPRPPRPCASSTTDVDATNIATSVIATASLAMGPLFPCNLQRSDLK